MNFKEWLISEEINPELKPTSKEIVLVNDGSFNPVHRGHVNVTLKAAEFCKNQGFKVIGPFMSPKHESWLQKKYKNKDDVLPSQDRLDLLKKSTEGTGIQIDDWEINSSLFKTSKEYEEHYNSKYPNATYVMIVGDDYGSCLPTPCFQMRNQVWNIRMPRTEELSSTKIRQAAYSGSSLSDIAFPAVADYMNKKQQKSNS